VPMMGALACPSGVSIQTRRQLVDVLRRRSPLGADRVPGRVGGIGVEPREAAALHRRDRATASDAEAALALDALWADVARHPMALLSRVSYSP
jgi:hypothetical protein